MPRLNPLAAIFLTVFVDLIGFGIIIPLLPFYAEHFNAGPVAVTLLMASYSLAQFIAAPIWGKLSDSHGRKPILIASLAGIAISYLWIGYASALWQLIAARLLAGAMAGNLAAAQAYIADVTPPERRAQGMGLIGAAFGLGFILGPALGGLLGGGDPRSPDFVAPALSSAGLSCLALVFAIFALDESLRPSARRVNAGAKRPGRLASAVAALGMPELRLLVLLFFLVTFVFAGMESTFALWSERAFGWGARQNGYLFAYTGVLAATVQGGLMRLLAPRFGERALLTQGLIGLVLGLALIPLVGSIPHLLVAMALLAYGAGVANPSLASLISLAAAEGQVGGTLGVSQSAASLARVLGPAFAGGLFGLFGRNASYIAGAAIMLFALSIAWRVMRRKGAR